MHVKIRAFEGDIATIGRLSPSAGGSECLAMALKMLVDVPSERPVSQEKVRGTSRRNLAVNAVGSLLKNPDKRNSSRADSLSIVGGLTPL